MTRKSIAAGLAALGLGTILAASLVWGLQHAALANPPLLGRAAPPLAIRTLTGTEVNLDALRHRPVVLNFWASWCGPCVEEGGVLSSAASSHREAAFVGADNRDTTSGLAQFELDHPHPYPVGPIVEGSYQSYGVAGLPATFFIDGDGVVVASFSGPLDAPTLDHYLGLIGA